MNNQHILIGIAGGTGSGKTVLVKSLLEQAAINDIPSVVIDPAGDYVFLALAEALKDDESLNPDNTFCQAQVDVQKMIDQLKEHVDSEEEEEEEEEEE